MNFIGYSPMLIQNSDKIGRIVVISFQITNRLISLNPKAKKKSNKQKAKSNVLRNNPNIQSVSNYSTLFREGQPIKTIHQKVMTFEGAFHG